MGVEYTWFGGKSAFLAERYGNDHGHGTPRQALEEIRDRHLKRVGEIDRLLLTTGPEEAAERTEREIAECHPDGQDRRCSCSHTTNVVAGKPLEATQPTPRPEPIRPRKWWEFWDIP
jgi:hypothetical protein